MNAQRPLTAVRQALRKFLARVAKFGPQLDRLLERWLPPQPDDNADWRQDADWAWLQQEPLRARALLRWAGWTVVLLLLWASVAQLDEVTKGEGRVIPSSQLQVIQAVDGGVVEALLVREGQQVEAGSVLLRIDPTRFVSNLRENSSQRLGLRLRADRLEALTANQPFRPQAAAAAEAPAVLAQERLLFESSRAELEASVGIARNQETQRSREIDEARSRYEQAVKELGLVRRELEVTRPLVQSGAVSTVETLRLERQVSTLTGTRDQSQLQIQRGQAALEEAQGKIQEVELNFRNRWRAELSETMAKLGSLSETSSALVDRVQKAEIRSPMRGTVKRLLVNTVGGVVQPGKEVVEIVPLDDALLLEAQVKPRDIAFLRPGQAAMVKFTAYEFSVYGGLEAVVEQIGADSVIDDKGNAFYTIRVRTKKTSLGEGLPIIPGMVAEVDVITGKKSVLSYLLKPVLRAHANALRER